MANPGSYEIRRVLWRNFGRIEEIHVSDILPLTIAPPAVEPDVLRNECLIAAPPGGSPPQPAFELRPRACQREIVDGREAVPVGDGFEMARQDGSAEQNRLASLMEVEDQAQPLIPVLLHVRGGRAPEHRQENIALQNNAFR